jgi:hypothetical protein
MEDKTSGPLFCHITIGFCFIVPHLIKALYPEELHEAVGHVRDEFVYEFDSVISLITINTNLPLHLTAP